jgi:hypothetical protein
MLDVKLRYIDERVSVMSQNNAFLACFMQFGGVAAWLTFSRLTVWLVGLFIVLRGSKPEERPGIIQAYAMCRPLISIRSNAGRCGIDSPMQDSAEQH